MNQEHQLRISVEAISSDVRACLGPGGLSNTLIVFGENAALVVDTQLTPELALQVKAVASEISGKPARYVLNTHGDTDHIFGNQQFWPESVLMCHRLTRERLLLQDAQTLINHAIRQRPHLRSKLEQVRLVIPELAFDSDISLDLGGLEVRCLFVGPAHTTGDVVVWAPERGVLFSSDLVFNRIFPVTRNADIDGWLSALDRLEALNPEIVVPGHGAVGDKQLLADQRGLLLEVRDAVQLAIERGLTAEEAQQEVRFPRYGALPKAADRIPEAIARIYSLALQSRQP